MRVEIRFVERLQCAFRLSFFYNHAAAYNDSLLSAAASLFEPTAGSLSSSASSHTFLSLLCTQVACCGRYESRVFISFGAAPVASSVTCLTGGTPGDVACGARHCIVERIISQQFGNKKSGCR